MDMHTAFDLEVRAHCPLARVVYDLFHVVAKFGREVISRVRVDAANRLGNHWPARRVVTVAWAVWRGILSRVRWPRYIGQLEGIDNKIKLIKRRACGYRDADDFFHRIKVAFPGNP